MSFLNQFSRRVLSVLDFGEDTVSTLIAEQKDGRYHVLGLGDAPAHGVLRGCVENTGDAVESVVASLRSAEESAGVRAEKLYCNFFYPDLESVVSRGSKILNGEGQIRDSDLKDVRKIAERAVGDFEKNIVYSREAGYTIDDRDFVMNPLGIFGRKIDVDMRILLADAARCESWRRIFEWAQAPNAVPVLSSWSTAYGVLSREDRVRYRLIAACGRDDLNMILFGNNMIADHRVVHFDSGEASEARQARVLSQLRRWVSEESALFDQILLAGRPFLSSKNLKELGDVSGKQVVEAVPTAVAGLENPLRTDLVGLLLVADELESKSPILHKERGLLPEVKSRAASFFKDYF